MRGTSFSPWAGWDKTILAGSLFNSICTGALVVCKSKIVVRCKVQCFSDRSRQTGIVMVLLLLRWLFCLLLIVSTYWNVLLKSWLTRFNNLIVRPATPVTGRFQQSLHEWWRFLRLVLIYWPHPLPIPYYACCSTHTLLTGYACTSGGYRMSRNRTLMARIPTTWWLTRES